MFRRLPAFCLTSVIGLGLITLPDSAFSACDRPSDSKPDIISANAFVDSIGVTYKFGDDKYYSDEATLRLGELGVQHIRGSLKLATAHADQLRDLNKQLGVKFTLYANGLPDAPDAMTGEEVHNAVSELGQDLLDGIEGTNEPDVTDQRTDWAQQAKDYQTEIWKAIKDSSDTHDVTVLGPSISATGIEKGSAKEIGNIDDIIDAVNVHPYAWLGTGFSSPEQPKGTLLKSFDTAKQMSKGNKPIIGTATGYPTQPISPPFANPDKTKAVYMPRLHLILFKNGMQRAFARSFIDRKTGGSDQNNNFGYLESDFTPKESFYAIRNLIAALKDDGECFSATPLKYSISDKPESLQEVLLQKSDGSYYLALWLGIERGPNELKPQIITVTVDDGIKSAETYRPNDGPLDDKTDIKWTKMDVDNDKSIKLGITDSVTLLHLTNGEQEHDSITDDSRERDSSGWVVHSPDFTPMSDEDAASFVVPMTENRQEDNANPKSVVGDANHYVPSPAEINKFLTSEKDADGHLPADANPYMKYVTGNFKGTTDEIIQWAAIKWGIPPDWIRAQAILESGWKDTQLGDSTSVKDASSYPEYSRQDGNHVFQSLGILQLRWNHPDENRAGTGAEPLRWKSTAFNLDFVLSTERFYFDDPQGKRSGWGDGSYKPNDNWLSLAGHYEPYPWGNDGQRKYAESVKKILAEKAWEKSNFPPPVPRGKSS